MDIIETFTTEDGKVIKVCRDPEPFNPREEFDNGTIMAYWSRHVIGDVNIPEMTAEEIGWKQKGDGDPIIAILPLYAMIHSGITVSTTPFGCRWDSGQFGWVYITQSKSDLMGFDDFTSEQLEEVIKAEVKNFDDYLTGQVYGYTIEGIQGDGLECCWGFIGDIDGVISEAKEAAKHCDDPAHERLAEELSERATYAGFHDEKVISPAWILNQLAGMRFKNSAGRDAYDYIKEQLEKQ